MPRRSAFSLWYVLAVIAIIGIMVGLLLPAAQSSRARSRAIKSYDDAKGVAQPMGGAMGSSATQDFARERLANDAYARMGIEEGFSQGAANNIALAQNLEPTELARKIVYEAELTVVVKDVESAEKKLLALLQETKGYIAESSVDRVEGQQLSGRWRLRVPVAEFPKFLDEVSKLGVAENRRQTAQDVTEEYVDLEAQAANKQQLEQRVVSLLEKSTGDIKDVIAVERELSRIRSEIERMEGRLKYLSNRTDLTTVTVTLRQEQKYEPEPMPTLTNRIGETWTASLTSLGEFGERFLLATVAATPWIVLGCLLAGPAFLFFSKRLRAEKRIGVAPESQETSQH